MDHETPRWSPDSSSLLYFTPAQTVGGEGEIWEIPALGGIPRPLVASISSGDMSHDGKFIAYLRSNDDHIEINVANREGSNPHVVASSAPESIYSNLRWSPDDTVLAYQAGRTFDFDVFYVAVSGGKPQHLTNDGNPMGGFEWLPDSSGVVYSSARGETTLYVPTMNLWAAHRGETRLRQLTFGETSYLSPDVGANGDLVAARTLTQFDIWKYPVDRNAKENVRQAVQITHQTGNVQTPSVSPGDREIVYLSDSGGRGTLWVLNVASSETRQITFEQDAQIAIGVPVWSPDGQYISYAVRGRTGWNVDQWVVKPDGTGAHKVMDGGGWAAWSLDSRWLYLSPPTATGFSLEKIAVDRSQRQLVQPEGTRPAPAKDGTLYFVINHTHASGGSDSEIRMAQPDNAPSKVIGRITSGREPTWQVIQPILSPDGKWLAAPLVEGPTTNLWRISTSDGRREKIVDFGNAATVVARRVSWSSDGKAIYAAVGKVEADVVLLSNLLPQ